jgi:hypothetical protein
MVDRGVIPDNIPAFEKYRIDIIYKTKGDPTPKGGYRLFLKIMRVLV